MPTRPGLRIATILGIPIYLHASWLIIFALITGSLGMQFTQQHPQWTSVQHWTAGLLTSLLFFASVLFHELSHSVVARHYKIRVVSITLFIFGGLAQIGRDASKAIQEFNIAIAGPIASFFLAGVFYALTLRFPFSHMIGALALWLSEVNLMLALFNLIPGFPLDGGRIFRALAWAATKDFQRATRMAGTVGKVFAYAMILYGAYLVFRNQFLSGIWIAFIGWFLRDAAQASMAEVAVREGLSGLFARDVMSRDVPSVPRDISLEEYGAEVQRTGQRSHLVVLDGRLMGLMDIRSLHAVPRGEWTVTSVQAVMVPRERLLWARPDDPLNGLLQRLLAANINQMPVLEDGSDGEAHIAGVVTRDSILRVIQTRSELGMSPAAR
jgi:Zn-dependent protease